MADRARELLDAYGTSRQEVIVGGDPPKTHLPREPMAPKAFAALRAVLDYCDDLDKVDLYAGPAFCLRTLIRTALEAP